MLELEYWLSHDWKREYYMNKITNKSLDYAAKVRYDKYIKLKHARDKYMKNRSSMNFDEVKRLSEDFDKVTCQS